MKKILAFLLTITLPIWFIPSFLIAMIGAGFMEVYKDILSKLENK